LIARYLPLRRIAAACNVIRPPTFSSVKDSTSVVLAESAAFCLPFERRDECFPKLLKFSARIP
jgi:hypothetical protein